jgi:UV DNA damage endonuclease
MPLTPMPAAYADAPWIEIEAKRKEEAIDGLRSWAASG